MKKSIFAISLLFISLESLATDMNVWTQPVLGTSTVWELHLVKNDGLNTHVKYRCSKLVDCWGEFENIKLKSNNFLWIKSVWMERLNGKIQILK